MADVPKLHVMVVTPTPERKGMVPRTHDTVTELGHGSSMPNQSKQVDDELARYDAAMQAHKRDPYRTLQPQLSSIAQAYKDAGGGKDEETARKELEGQVAMRSLVASLWTFDASWSTSQQEALARLKEWTDTSTYDKDGKDISRNSERIKRMSDTLYKARYREIYIHSKLMIIDDSMFTLGSANLNLRSFGVDSEINIASDDAVTAMSLRRRVWAQHTDGQFPGGIATDQKVMTETFKNWQKVAQDNLFKKKGGIRPSCFLVAFQDDRTSNTRLLITLKLPRLCNISHPRAALAALLILFTLTACAMTDLPRNMNLKAFNPHRADFTCVHEAPKLPPITNESEMLFQQGMVVTSNDLWPNQRDYRKAAQLWEQAVAKGHWKAAMNLAGLYERGLGVQRDAERAVLIVEGLMKQGVPGAFDKMGTYHQSGIGVKRDIDRAYGFWQLAADMGSPAAQTHLGYKLDAAYDDAQMGTWGNRKVGLKMLECAFAQGYAEAAYRLGQSLNLGDQKYARALVVLHEGAKFGSADAANYLSSSFAQVDPLTGNQIDRTRAERYSLLGDALELNPDLRFPNLDKVLPLPPAALPLWDGQRETLINAAKAVVIKQPTPATPGAIHTSRAHIPQAMS